MDLEEAVLLEEINLVEAESAEKLGLARPSEQASIFLIDGTKINYAAGYSAGGELIDSYIFPKGFTAHPDKFSIMVHEAVHRLHYVNMGLNANPVLSPSEVYDLNIDRIGKISQGDLSTGKVLDFFRKVLLETFAHYGQMVVRGEELPESKIERDHKKMVARSLFPNDEGEQLKLFSGLRKGFSDGSMSYHWANNIGKMISISFYENYVIDERFVEKINPFFVNPDLVGMTDDEFNPYLRYLKLIYDFGQVIQVR